MPPKPKLYKSTGKSKNDPQGPSQSSSVSLTSEQADQFQVELYWCIQQLQSALGSGKLNNKQVQDNTKALNTLMSNNSSIVQKRQVMRLSFGNYREKIAAAEEKASKNLSNIKVKPAKPDKKSVFVKKSFSLSHGDNNFKFNFAALSENVENNSNADEITFKQNEIWNRKERMCQYLPSDNSFRFNFEVDEAMS